MKKYNLNKQQQQFVQTLNKTWLIDSCEAYERNKPMPQMFMYNNQLYKLT